MTLLELLVALAVFGLVLVTLAAMLHFTYSISAARMHRSEVTAESTPVFDFLEALIGDARTAAARPGGPTAFDGQGDRLSLVAMLDTGAAKAGGLQRISLERVDGALQIAWAPYGETSLPAPNAAGATTLLPTVSDLRFRYFGPSAPGSAPGWHDTWAGMPSLPLLVDIVLAQAGGEGRRELVVAPRVTGTASSNQR